MCVLSCVGVYDGIMVNTREVWTECGWGRVCHVHHLCSLRARLHSSDLYLPAPAGLDGDGGERQLVRPREAACSCV